MKFLEASGYLRMSRNSLNPKVLCLNVISRPAQDLQSLIYERSLSLIYDNQQQLNSQDESLRQTGAEKRLRVTEAQSIQVLLKFMTHIYARDSI